MAQKKKPEIETEQKISLSAQEMETVFRALSRKSGAGKVTHKYRPRMYYDTPRLGLYRHDLSLRVQYKSGKSGQLGCYEQTVKMEVAPKSPLEKGVLLRKECKDDLPTHRPSLAAVSDRQARKALAPFKGKKLVHIFTAAMERRYFDWKLRDGKKKGVVEVAFDRGEIVLPRNNRSRGFCEIEIELKKGGPRFIALARDEILRLAPSARVQKLSKAEQGIRFFLGHRK